MPADILTFDDLVVEYPDSRGRWRPVLAGVSLTVRRGERVGLVGESGSGKSVAALAALGLVLEPGRITGGTVTVGRVDLRDASETQLQKIRGGVIGLVFQEVSAAVNPVVTVGAHILETVRAHRSVSGLDAQAESRRLLDTVALDRDGDLYRAYPHELSGGQLQRVMIALALAGEPELLIADEPTTALDLVTQARVLDLLRRSTSDGTALLLISHDLAVVAGLVDRVVVVHAGQVVEEAPTRRLFDGPLHPYTRQLLSRRGADSAVREVAPATQGCAFAPRCSRVEASCTIEPPTLRRVDDGVTVRCPVVVGEQPASGRPGDRG